METNNKQYTAVNAFIFAGSFSIGVMNAGFNLKKVLEISNSQPKENAYYFIKNYPNIPVILPDEWENNEYLDNLKSENVDLMCCNCPCSSLSRVNRWAKVDGKQNVHFYRLFNIFKHVQPKVFVIENAPTLIKLGKPILNDMVNELKDLYRFTIIRDLAGNHNVPMKRMRTLVVGWRKDCFDNIPILNQDIQKKTTVKDVLNDILDKNDVNDCKSIGFDCISSLYKYGEFNRGIVASLANKLINGTDAEKTDILNVLNQEKMVSAKKYVMNVKHALENNLGFWDKTPKRVPLDSCFPSLSKPQEYLHPIHNRCLTVLELQRMMNYPDTFDFSNPNNECKLWNKIAIGQGVPVNFGKYIANQVKLALDNKLSLDDSNSDIIFQHHIEHKYSKYKYEEFIKLEELKIDKNSEKLN